MYIANGNCVYVYGSDKILSCHNLFLILKCTIVLMTNRELEGRVDSSAKEEGEKLSKNQVSNIDIYRNLPNYRGITGQYWLEM